MNRVVKYLPFIFGVFLAVLLILSIRVTLQSPFFYIQEGKYQKELTYHYSFYLPESDYSFFRNFRMGALNAGDALDCAISFHSLDSDPLSLEFASYSGVDGIAIYPAEKNKEILEYLDRIVEAGIPVVQIENEILRNENTFLIGTNNFESGKAIGKLALSTGKDRLNIALIYSDKNPGLMSENNLIEMGLFSVLGPSMGTLTTKKTSLNPLDAERFTYELMRKPADVDIIVLTDPNDTLVTVQAIIDMNMVGDVHIIGFGDDQSIRDYIEKGVILGSIVRNPFRIGFSAVMALKEICVNGYTSAYVDTGINIISGEPRSEGPKGGPSDE